MGIQNGSPHGPPVKVLFVCVGNACRSQMAEGFARRYGSDVMNAASAGVLPAPMVPGLTRQVMLEKNIDLADHFPKHIDAAVVAGSDLIINMSGFPMPGQGPTEVREWDIRDPFTESEQVYREVRDEIEQLVMQLILELRGESSRSERRGPRTAGPVLAGQRRAGRR